jgi:hypothetical protein
MLLAAMAAVAFAARQAQAAAAHLAMGGGVYLPISTLPGPAQIAWSDQRQAQQMAEQELLTHITLAVRGPGTSPCLRAAIFSAICLKVLPSPD